MVLNGAPRTGKTSIAAHLVARGWVSLGVDEVVGSVEPDLRPSIGLRPGGERPELEPHVRGRYVELFAEVAAVARSGGDVVVDVGLHADYATPFDAWALAHELLDGVDVWWVAVDCPVDEVLRRRAVSPGYLAAEIGTEVPEPVRRWHEAVHEGHRYDVAVDTSLCPSFEAASFLMRILGREKVGESRPPAMVGVSVAGRHLGRALGLDPSRRHHVAVVGAGGKSTTVGNLARHLAASGPTVMTTTTKMGADQDSGWRVVTGPDPVGQIAAAPPTEWPVVVWGELEGERAIGVSVDVADALHRHVGNVVNEADGARRRSFKAPGSYEPVVAPTTTLVVSVAGVDALGGTIAEVAHRPEIVAAMANRDVNDVLTEEAMAAVLLHPDGQRRAVPETAHHVVLLSKVAARSAHVSLRRLLHGVPTLGVLHRDQSTG